MGHAGRPLWPHVPNSGFDSRDWGPPGFADRFDAAFPRNTDAGMVTLLPTVNFRREQISRKVSPKLSRRRCHVRARPTCPVFLPASRGSRCSGSPEDRNADRPLPL